jgi:hypothetical protein
MLVAQVGLLVQGDLMVEVWQARIMVLLEAVPLMFVLPLML